MNKQQLYNEFNKFIDKKDILLDEPMKNHTSFKIGGPADILLMPSNIGQIKMAVKVCKQHDVPYYVIGNGSNLLVRDKGIRCVLIKIAENFNDVHIDANVVKVQAGILLSTLAKKIIKASLKGFEFASGIPGSVGGAIAMNAGAYGGEMKDVVKSCTLLDDQGNIFNLPLEKLEMSYRTSIVQKKGYIVLEVFFELEIGNYEEIKAKVDELTLKRTTKQPLHLPSAGSIFKRPEGYFAGQLIQESNLKGMQIGGAQVSELHSGFIVNTGNATAENVLDLITYIQKEVKQKFGVDLHPEVRVIGEE